MPVSARQRISGAHHLQTHPLPPQAGATQHAGQDPALSLQQKKISSRSPELALGVSRAPTCQKNVELSLPRLGRGRASSKWPPRCQEPYRVPGVLDDARFLRQDLDELLGLPLAEHHAADAGHERLVGQVEGPIRVRRGLGRKEEELGPLGLWQGVTCF